MDISQSPATCGACGSLLGLDAWGCLLCGRFLCARHFASRKGVAICQDCQDERLRLESSSAITEDEEERIVALITRDLAATVGPGLEGIAIAEAARVRLFASTVLDYERQVVEDVQQCLHDEHLDTTWPTCPQHPNYPLWYSAGWWRYATSGAVAKLGELADVQRAGR